MKPLCLTVIAALLFVAALPVFAAATTGTLLAPSAYVWGDKLGWVNLNPVNGGLIITDSSVSGYAWSRQFGWINFNPVASGQGVRNTAEGELSGSAWVGTKGWLDMSGVRIGADGKFSGIAGQADTPAGRLSFDCASCSAVTDWRPASVRQTQGASGGGWQQATPVETPVPEVIPNLPIPVPQPEIPPTPTEPVSGDTPKPETPGAKTPIVRETGDSTRLIEAHNEPLTLFPNQSGTLTQDFDDGSFARIDIVSGASAGEFTIKVTPAIIDFRGYDPSIKPIGNFFFDIDAFDAKGKPVHSFDAPLKITLPFIGGGTALNDLGVYWFEEGAGEWERVEAAAFSEGSVSFYTSHLTRFAILSAPGNPQTIRREPADIRAFLLFALPAFALLAALALYWGLKKPRVPKAKPSSKTKTIN